MKQTYKYRFSAVVSVIGDIVTAQSGTLLQNFIVWYLLFGEVLTNIGHSPAAKLPTKPAHAPLSSFQENGFLRTFET